MEEGNAARWRAEDRRSQEFQAFMTSFMNVMAPGQGQLHAPNQQLAHANNSQLPHNLPLPHDQRQQVLLHGHNHKTITTVSSYM